LTKTIKAAQALSPPASAEPRVRAAWDRVIDGSTGLPRRVAVWVTAFCRRRPGGGAWERFGRATVLDGPQQALLAQRTGRRRWTRAVTTTAPNGLHRPLVGTFVSGIVSRDGSVVGGRADCDGGGRRLVGSIVGSTGVKNASPWADLPPKAMSPFAVETRSPGRNVGSFFTPSGARPKGSLPLQVQFPTSSLR